MASKVLLLLGLFAFLLVVSEMAESASQAATVKSESEETVQPDQYHGGNGGYNNGGGGYNNGGGGYNNGGGGYNNGGGGYNNGGGRGGGYNGGRGCRHGCCYYRGYRNCVRCCSYAGEVVQTQPGH